MDRFSSDSPVKTRDARPKPYSTPALQRGGSPASPVALTPEEMRCLLQELQAHPSELEMQNAQPRLPLAGDKLLKLNQQLESRVLERTAELHQTVQALEAKITRREHLEREILEINEREQCHLGQDLHEGLGQELAGIAMLGDIHARQLQAESHPLSAAAAKIATYLRTTIEGTRQLATALYPIELTRCGLLRALKDLAAETSRRCGIHCELRQSAEAPHLEKSAEIHLYRIIKEGIANAVKHAGAQRICIESRACPGTHVFTVTDDGVGFDPASVHPGMGLLLMNYRARVIGAQITVEHPQQGGCRITCQLPIDTPPRSAP